MWSAAAKRLLRCIEEEQAAGAVSLVVAVDGKASDEHGRYRVAAAASGGRSVVGGRQLERAHRVVASDAALLLVEEERRADVVLLLALPRISGQPGVELRLPADEGMELESCRVERPRDEHPAEGLPQ
jgi:hypothetical protein